MKSQIATSNSRDIIQKFLKEFCMDKEMDKVSAEEQSPLIAVEQVQYDIRRMIYVIRNQQVI